MKTSTFKKIISTAFCVMMLMSVIFLISSCKALHSHTFENTFVGGSCERESTVTRTCTDPSCDYTETVTIEAYGHDLKNYDRVEPTCTETGCEAYVECRRCNYTTYSYSLIIPALGHTEDTPVIDETTRVNPTCEGKGSYVHNIYCKVCGEHLKKETVSIPANGHEKVTVPAKDPSCIIGYTKHEVCTVCNTKFGYIEINPAYDHIEYDHMVKINEVEPTCTTDGGYDLVLYCKGVKDGCTVIFESEHVVIPAYGHDMVSVEAKDPTCTSSGYYDYEYCKTCNENNKVRIERLPHEYVSATCTTSKYCSVCNNTFGEPLGHTLDTSYTVVNLVKPTCTVEGSYKLAYYCTVCEEIAQYVTELDPATGKYEPKVFIVEPVLHRWNDIEAKDPTCTEIGWNAHQQCAKCSERVGYVEYPALEHVPVLLPAVPATCTETGLTDGYSCDRCKVVYQPQDVVEATGHSFDPVTGYCAAGDARYSVGLVYTAVDGGYAVAGMGSCTDVQVIIPESIDGVKVVAIADDAFHNNADIISVVLPESVKSIGDRAFYRCESLVSVDLGGVETIDFQAFSFCISLETVIAGASLKTVGFESFFGCYDLAVVNYRGTAAEWAAISFGRYNEKITDITPDYI